MAQLKINRCKVCTKPLPMGVSKCSKCGTEHQFVPEVVNPLRFSPKQAEEYKAIFENQAKADPNDTNSLFGMGLVYLGLQNYELANRNFQQAVDQTPDDPDVYYYYALSLFAHRSPTLLTALEAERIEMWLHTAIKIQAKRKYLILEMILLQGAFKGKGKAVPAGKPEPEELLKQALATVREEDELYEIEQHVTITDERNREFLSELRGENKNFRVKCDALEVSLAAYASLCDYPKGASDSVSSEDGVTRLLDTTERKRFFEGIYMPERPQLRSKDSYLRPIWKSVKTLVIAGVAWFILLIVIAILGWMPDHKIHRESPEVYVEKRFPDLSNMRKKEKIEEVKAAFAKDVEKDSAFRADNVIVQWNYSMPGKRKSVNSWGAPTEEEIAALPAEAYDIELHAIASGWRMWATILLILAAPAYWIIATLVAFRKCAKSRAATSHQNHLLKQAYKDAVESYKNRPTVEDYKRFCQLFVGPNAGLVAQGDAVSTALRQAGISESDVTKGKVYFFNCFFDCTADGIETDNPEVVLRHMGLNVAVAMPDQVLYMTGIWDTTSDTLPSFEISGIMYSQIAVFQKTADQIIIKSTTGSELAPITTNWGDLPGLFQYQAIESGDVLTYSRTRTTDRDEFYKSLVDMHGRYNKQ